MMGFGLLWMFVVLLVPAGIVALIVLATVRLTGNSRKGSADARRILDERYARGEIGTDEYQRTKRELG